MQKFFVYKLNIYNKYESPWEGTRVCRRKNLKSFTFLRKKILKKNILKPFWKFNIEKDIQIVKNQVLKWNLEDSENLISRINETELNIKKNYTNSLNIVSDFIISIAK